MKKCVKMKLLTMMVVLAMILSMAVVTPVTVLAVGTTYYVDSVGGNDNYNGTSPSTPWQTLNKVNSITFQPGDQILFKCGRSWSGTLHPLGSGNSTNVITINKYDTGSKPIINGPGTVGSAAVYLYNQEYWTIQNLEVTNDAATAGSRYGVYIEAQNAGTLHNIRLQYLDVHNVKGLTDPGGSPPRWDAGGIVVSVRKVTGDTPTLFDGINIENNNIHDSNCLGIETQSYWADASTQQYMLTNVVIRNNTITNMAADGIVVCQAYTPLIEYNKAYHNGTVGGTSNFAIAIWDSSCYSSIFQFNDAARTVYTGDSTGYDIDLDDAGTPTFQYNYSHDNEGGFFLVMEQSNPVTGIIRYNISQNDSNSYFRLRGATLNIYNNVIYNSNAETISITNEGLTSTPYFYNNIFHTTNTGTTYPTFATYDYNCYSGHNGPSSDTHKVQANPQFVNPGTGSDGINTVYGYKLQSTSPCINAGKVISGNGGGDYWGNTLYNGAPDIGAHEYYSGGTELLSNPGFESGTSSWTAMGSATLTADTGTVRSGSYSCKATSRSAAWDGPKQDITSVLNANGQGNYNMSAWVRMASGTDNAQVTIQINDTGGPHYFYGSWTAVNSIGWNQNSATMNVTWSGMTSAYLYVQTQNTTGDMYVDDCSLKKAVPTSELLTNPGYDSGTSPWTAMGSGTLTANSVTVHTGSYSCKETSRSAEWDGPKQDITSVLNTNGQGNYNMSAWVRMASGTDNALVTIQINDTGGPHYFNGSWTAVNSIGWNQNSATVNVTWSGMTSAYLYVQTQNTSGDMYVDDCSLKKQ